MKKVNLFLADGFEEIEAITVVDVLRRAGVDIKTVSITNDKEVRGAHNIIVKADKIFESSFETDADMLVLPGGMPGTSNLEAHAGLKDLLKDFAAKGKYIAAICAAPSVLGKLGLLQDREATCYPGFEKHLKGAQVKDIPVIQHGNFITSMGPGTALDFAMKLVELLVNNKTAQSLKDGMIVR